MEMYLNVDLSPEQKFSDEIFALVDNDVEVVVRLTPSEKVDILNILNAIKPSILFNMNLTQDNAKMILSKTYNTYCSIASNNSVFITITVPLIYLVYLRKIIKYIEKEVPNPISETLRLNIKSVLNSLYGEMRQFKI